MTLAVLFLHALATVFMTGLIWFVQVVHYPLKAKVGNRNFISYQEAHQKKTGWIVGPPMLVEISSGLWLAIALPEPLSPALLIFSLTLLALIWLSTAVFSVPCHRKLTKGFHPGVHRKLVSTNWIRTTLWSGRSILALYFLLSFRGP